MIAQNVKEKAFGMFLEGHSLRSIAKVIKVAKSTVERWSVKFEWYDQRSIVWHQRKQSALQDHISKSKHASLALSEFLFEQLMSEIGWYKAVESGSIPAKARRFKPRTFRQIVSAYWSACYGEATHQLLTCMHLDQSIKEQLSAYTSNEEMIKKAQTL